MKLTVFVTISLFSTITSYETFQVAYYWNYINFTWLNPKDYQDAIKSGRYIPKNNIISSIKAYKEDIYLSVPRFGPGTPVTLAKISNVNRTSWPWLVPYPSWDMNVKKNCSTLQNVQSIEIDTKGVMWVLDGNRFNNLTDCPPKIILLDINRGGAVIQTYVLPEVVSPRRGGWLNDVVVDESDGGYAYITETSAQDPGIVVYSKLKNLAWKVRDRSVFPDVKAAGYVVKGVSVDILQSADGIALAPEPRHPGCDRKLFYSSMTSFKIYALSTRILKNQSIFTESTQWRRYVEFVGHKSSQGDRLYCDNEGNLYYCLHPQYAIAKWNVHKQPFDKNAKIIYQNSSTVEFPDGFGMDTKGNLYVTCNNGQHFPPTRMRILKHNTGTKSYLYS